MDFQVTKVSGEPPPSGPEFLQQWDSIAFQEMQPLIDQVVSMAQSLAPNDIGDYARSLKGVVEQTVYAFGVSERMAQSRSGLGVVLGIVYSDDDPIKSCVIEGVDLEGNRQDWGRKPLSGFPPVDEMRAYAARKTGEQDPKQLDRLAFLFGRKVNRDGIVAVRPIERAFDFYQGQIDDVILNRIPELVAWQV